MKTGPFTANLPAAVAITLGSILLLFGLITFASPTVMNHYEIAVASAESRIGIRAIVGGGEIGLGLFILLGNLFGVELRSRLLVAAVVFGSVATGRLAASLIEIESVIPLSVYREIFAEFTIFACALAALQASHKR